MTIVIMKFVLKKCETLQILIHILKYLPLNAIKACRLVNHKWRDCCSVKEITDKEKFVFYFELLSVDEVNTFFVDVCKRTEISVEFISFPLEHLDFQKFGQNILSLELTGCRITFMETLKNVFCYTPNLCIFQCSELFFNGSSSVWKPRVKREIDDDDEDRIRIFFFECLIDTDFLLNIINNLIDENFRNENLKKLNISSLSDYTHQNASMMKHLFRIFPNINSIHLRRHQDWASETTMDCPLVIKCSEGIIDMIHNRLENVILEPNIKELSVCFLNFEDERAESNFFFSLPKFVARKNCLIHFI